MPTKIDKIEKEKIEERNKYFEREKNIRIEKLTKRINELYKKYVKIGQKNKEDTVEEKEQLNEKKGTFGYGIRRDKFKNKKFTTRNRRI